MWAHDSCLRRPSKPSYREELASKGAHDMPEQKQMVFRPNADFSDRGNWISLGNDRYGALRIRLVLIPSKEADSRIGPMLEEAYNIDGAHEQEIKTKRGRVIINQTTMSGAIEQATTARLFDRVSAKVGAEASAGVPLNSIKFASELNAEFASEVTNSLKRILSEESSYTIQETEEKEHTLKLKPGNGLKTAYLRRRYWPRRWDVYIYSAQYIELSFKTGWLWSDVRKTIAKTDEQVLGLPLTSVIYYEPQDVPNVFYGPVENELKNPEDMEVVELREPMPRIRLSAIAPHASLEELAKIAFPASWAEKIQASGHRKRLSEQRSARKAKKVAAKKPAKKAPRKMAAKKSMRKASAKKAARKAAAKKR
jgi:hypothetical protein